MTTNQPIKNILHTLVFLAITVFGCGWGNVQATDISNAPLVTSSTSSVLPNVMFVLDDSGSMGWSYMPDNASNFDSNYGYASSQCNGVYYDPRITYAPPVDSTGVSFANSSFTAAWTDGYNTGAGSTNLSTSFRPSSNYTAQAAFYYNYSGTQTTARQKDYYNTTGTFYQECNSTIGSTPGSAVFTKVVVSATSGPGGTDERVNFANWYSYYRTRMLMMKTAAGMAFKPIDNKFRIGFMTINNNVSPDILNFAPFDAAQKSAWYTKLYSSSAGNSTPLREALSNVGRIYAHKLTSLYGTAITDPIQYSCQQNFTILSTDGFWNGTSGYKLDGATAIGNEDGSEPRPYNDGGSVTFTKSTSQTLQSQTQISKSTSQLLSRTTQSQQQISQLQQDVGTLQSQTTQLQAVTAHLQSSTKSSSGASWTAFADTTSCTYHNAGSYPRMKCQYNPTTTTVGVSSCTVNASSSTADGTVWTGPTAVTACQTAVTVPYANAASCTVTTTPDTSGNTTQCQYAWATAQGTPSCSSPVYVAGNYTNATVYQNCTTVITSPYANSATCTASAVPDTSGYTTQCQTLYNGSLTDCTAGSVTVGGACYVPAGSCAPSSSGGQTTTCTTLTTGPTYVASCTPQVASSGNQWTQITCNTATLMAPTPVASCTAATGSASNNYVNTVCSTVTTGPVSSSSCTAATASASNNWTTTTCSAGVASGGTSNTLADAAEYYYATDLRTSALGNTLGALGTDVSVNNVPKSGLDAASWQHMTTFTLGLGARGRMVFDPSYKTQTATSFSPADYYSIGKGYPADPTYYAVTANPTAGICSWQAAGTTCNWPVPGSDQIENVDDLWHAAVDGRGTYFSATNPTTLATSLSNALAGVSAITGASASATTSSPNVTAGDNFVFSSTFTTQQWDGELLRQQLDLTTGAISTTIDWSAQAKLDAATPSLRNIYTYSAGAANHLQAFNAANFAASPYFNVPNISTSPPSGTGLTQYLCASPSVCLSATDQALAAGGNLVNYLRGDRTNEGFLTDNSKYYRQRVHILGDTVHAEAVYVKTSYFNYADAGYSAFAASNLTRVGMVYIAANDGMLHAFKAGGTTITAGDGSGEEQWAYIPSMLLPELYKLADKSYASKHQYYVDGTPTQGDAYFNGAWHTILVGGLNAGGRGFYALDVTDPAAPKALWEFTDANMGLSFGNPVITKLKDGTWVVLVTSGYNNPGDGMGHLYVLNAATGAVIRDISTGVGGASGLGRIAAYVRSGVTDNTVLQVYGGDMLGNLWRFDVNGDVGASGYDAQLLATLRGPAGNIQPITDKPVIGIVSASNGNNVVVYVGTGRYLGVTDLSDTSVQSIYGIKDPLSAGTTPGTAIYNNPRTISTFVQQTLISTICPPGSPTSVCTTGQSVRTSSNNTVDFATNSGWYVDLSLDAGERAFTDPLLQLGVLGFTTNVPSVSACAIGGYSFRYFFDYKTGGPLTSATSPNSVVSTALGNALATRPVYIELPNGTVIELTTLSGSIAGGGGGAGNIVTNLVPVPPSNSPSRRTSWRELITE